MVNKEGIDLKATASAVSLLDHTYYRCKLKRLGSALQSSRNSGEMGFSSCRNSLKYGWNTGSLSNPYKPGGSSATKTSSAMHGQQSGSVLYPMMGETHSTPLLREVEPIMLWAERNLLDLKAVYLSGPPERGGRSSVLELSKQQWVVPSSLGIQLDHESSGPPGNRSLCFISEVPRSPVSSPGRSSEFPFKPLEMQDSISFSPKASNLEVPSQIIERISNGGSNSSPGQCTSVPLAPSRFHSYSLSRKICTPSTSQSEHSCLDTERQKFQSLGGSSEVISTLLKARKPSTNCVYSKIWNKFKMFAAGRGSDPAIPSSSLLLDFLPAGLNLSFRVLWKSKW